MTLVLYKEEFSIELAYHETDSIASKSIVRNLFIELILPINDKLNIVYFQFIISSVHL